MFAKDSKNRLTPRDVARFSGETLFARLGRSVCGAGCLPRKELYEAWETARRVRRLFKGGRVVDLCGGHGLLAHVMLLLDPSSPAALVVDTQIPDSAAPLRHALSAVWPRLASQVRYLPSSLEQAALDAGDVIVSCHACGSLTDRVLDVALGVGARVAVLPCCHDQQACDPGPLAGWLDAALAIDAMRALRLTRSGYRVWTQRIPQGITPKNRLLVGAPGLRVPASDGPVPPE